MKVKVKPDDFYVAERINVIPKPKGKFALYRLETLDLPRHLQNRYQFRRLQRLGLKDRYSHSIQYVANSWVIKEPIVEKNFIFAMSSGWGRRGIKRDFRQKSNLKTLRGCLKTLFRHPFSI